MKTYRCLHCDKESLFTRQKVNKYCSNECQQEVVRNKTFLKILEGKISERSTIRKTLIWKFGHKCFECELSEWRGFPIPLELDHIDGDAGNDRFNNLRLLCANCHGITPTWKGRNKGKGRSSRGLKLS